MTGYSLEETLGRNCRFFQGPDTDPVAVAKIRKAIEFVTTFRREVLNYRKDGSSFWNDVTVSTVRDADGFLVGFVGIQNDVSEQ